MSSDETPKIEAKIEPKVEPKIEPALTIADAPQTDSDFDTICERAEIPKLREQLRREFPALRFEVLDLRREAWRTERGVIVERRVLARPPGHHHGGEVQLEITIEEAPGIVVRQRVAELLRRRSVFPLAISGRSRESARFVRTIRQSQPATSRCSRCLGTVTSRT